MKLMKHSLVLTLITSIKEMLVIMESTGETGNRRWIIQRPSHTVKPLQNRLSCLKVYIKNIVIQSIYFQKSGPVFSDLKQHLTNVLT